VNARSALECGSGAAAFATRARPQGGSSRCRSPRRLRRCLAALALSLWAVTCWAQENPCLTRAVTVGVFNSNDGPVKSLDAAHFRGRIQGGNVEIMSAKYDATPRRIVFLVDTSAAMTQDQARWQSELAMAEGLVSWLPAQAPVALLTFASSKPERIDFAQGHKAVNDALAGLEGFTVAPGFSPAVSAETHLSDGIDQALAMLDPPKPGDAICLISDANGDWNAKDAAEGKMSARGVRLFGFLPESALAQNSESQIQDAKGAAAIRGLIEATGGDYLIFGSSPKKGATDLSPEDRSKLLVASRSFAQEMSETYRLEIRLPQTVEGAREWTLEASADSKKKDSHWRVIYPKRLPKCP